MVNFRSYTCIPEKHKIIGASSARRSSDKSDRQHKARRSVSRRDGNINKLHVFLIHFIDPSASLSVWHSKMPSSMLSTINEIIKLYVGYPWLVSKPERMIWLFNKVEVANDFVISLLDWGFHNISRGLMLAAGRRMRAHAEEKLN